MKASVFRLSMANPGDVSELAGLIDAGTLAAQDIVAIIGKTEGNGGVNDFTRGFFVERLMTMLSGHLGDPAEALARRIPCILSGGTEGVLSPHYQVYVRSDSDAPPNPAGALAIGSAFARKLDDAEIGTAAHARAVAAAISQATADAGIDDPANVRFVQVKTPALTADRLAALPAVPGQPTPSADRSMALARAAGAFGVGVALGDLSADAIDEALFLADFTKFCSRASVSSGPEVYADEIIVLGNSRNWSGNLRIAHAPMEDALDLAAIFDVVAELGLGPGFAVADAERARIRAVLVKCEPDRRGRIRGQRHTMLNDIDINPQRHIRGALGGLVAGALGDTRIFVSGGAEHQGPDGGGLIAVIAEMPDGA